MPIKFGGRGYIEPPERVELSIDEFKKYFVDNFPKSQTREKLFQGYKKYTQAFRTEITKDIIQWVGGSFTTTKLNPRDIDVVTIIAHETFDEKHELIEKRFRKTAKSKYGVDAYIVASYPEDHEKSLLFQGNLVYWDNQFSKTRKNRAGKRFKRGYVQVIHQKIEL